MSFILILLFETHINYNSLQNCNEIKGISNLHMGKVEYEKILEM